MRRVLISLASAVAGVMTWISGHAALSNGVKAPDFKVPATLGGKEFEFSLADALKKGPVVLYFYPAAFTPGCTLEAHAFAEATPEFQALGATVIGMSTDKIETLNRFSVSECRSKFAVASDADGRVTKAYDAALPLKKGWANRISYVIAPSGEVIYSYTSLQHDKHVENALAAVRNWREKKAQN
jgi:peroxiredoxin Q/BCP